MIKINEVDRIPQKEVFYSDLKVSDVYLLADTPGEGALFYKLENGGHINLWNGVYWKPDEVDYYKNRTVIIVDAEINWCYRENN